MKKVILISILIFNSILVQAQDTIATKSIEQAILKAKEGHYVSLGMFSDSSKVFPSKFFEIPPKNLIALIIDNCAYENFPEELKNYQNIVYFRYSWFLFLDPPKIPFPPFLCDLKNLESLAIQGLPMEKIPEEIRALDKLTYLEIYYCQVPAFPRVVLEMENLIHLNLSCNAFDKIPEDIDRLKNLKSLKFDGGACGSTPIIYVPETIGNLRDLEFFSLGYTEKGIDYLPLSLFNLEQLRYLGCNGCGLKGLPEDLGKLKKLETLSLINLRNFEKFPESMFKLPKLKSFHFHQYGEPTNPELFAQKERLDNWGEKLERYNLSFLGNE